MKTRATITIDPELHLRAKKLARRRQTTVSGLFESYLRSQPIEEDSVVDNLIGCATLKPPPAQRDPLREQLLAKYLR
jgi:hypothetical protein